MRVIAGEFKGRTIKAVSGTQTRPTLDKVKESIFNAMGQYLQGGRALDLYAGSGNLGIEALSRGCDHCVFVDKSYQAIRVIKENISNLGLEEYTDVYKLDAFKALSLLENEQKQFDFIFLDPPYKQQKINDLLTLMMDLKLLNHQAIVMCEHLKDDQLINQYQSLHKVKEYVYGITKITFYQKEGDLDE